MIDLFSTATLGTKEAQSKDLLGKVFEYFLGEFALAEGKKGGQFYTPSSVVSYWLKCLNLMKEEFLILAVAAVVCLCKVKSLLNHHSDHYKTKNGKGLNLNPLDRISIYGQEATRLPGVCAK